MFQCIFKKFIYNHLFADSYIILSIPNTNNSCTIIWFKVTIPI